MKKYALPLTIIASLLCFAACSDDNSNDNNDKKDPTVQSIDKWIGSPCTCEGSGCEILNIPLPAPDKNATIVGCENIDLTGIEGGRLACLRTIKAELAEVAPPTYFPKGYCAIAAVGCEGSDFCGTAAFGETETFTTCPTGTVMMNAPFDYAIVGQPSKIVDKICLKSCNTDADCNTDPEAEISCIEREGHKFCYNETNFNFLGNSITYQKF